MSAGEEIDFATLPARPRHVREGRVAVPSVCALDLAWCRRRATLTSGGVELGRSRTEESRRTVDWLVVDLVRPLPADDVVRVVISGEDMDSDVESEEAYSYRFTWRFSCRNAPPGDVCRR